MKSVFADTFYYIALLDAKDSAHERAVRATRELNSSTVTTAWVLLELANALSASPHRTVFARFLDHLRANPSVIIYEAEKELFDRGRVTSLRSARYSDWSGSEPGEPGNLPPAPKRYLDNRVISIARIPAANHLARGSGDRPMMARQTTMTKMTTATSTSRSTR
jgi:hypothetical protein